MENCLGRPYWKALSAEELKALRKKLSLTQVQFSEAYSLDLSSLKNWEQGRCLPQGVTSLYLRMIATDSNAVNKLISAVKKHADSNN